MAARYLIRFDDICPTLNWWVWDQVERLLIDMGVAPILAVVPDNRDPKLCVAPGRSDFWGRVREWQARGWTIGLHGFRHEYVSKDAGLIGLNSRSEFAGLPLYEQDRKIADGLAIFTANGARADAWIAPGHSFDSNTLAALQGRGIRVVSDGFFLRPVRWLDMTWVPQQLWRFSYFPTGVWTVCQHINSYGQADIENLRRDLGKYREQMVSLPTALESARSFRPMDALVSRSWLGAVRVKRVLRAQRHTRRT